MVIFHGELLNNQMVDSPNGGFTKWWLEGNFYGKTLVQNPSKPIKNHPLSVFPEKIPLGSSSVQFWDTTVWKIYKNMKLSACICCQSCQSSVCRLHFSHLLYWFTEAEGGEWVLAALRISKSCEMQGEKEMRKFENETITRSTILGELHCLMIQDLWR